MLREDGFSGCTMVFFVVVNDETLFDRASGESEAGPARIRSLDDLTRSDHDMGLQCGYNSCFFGSEPAPPVGRPRPTGSGAEEKGEDDGTGLKTAKAKSFKDEGMMAALFSGTGLDDLLAMGKTRTVFEGGAWEAGVGS